MRYVWLTLRWLVSTLLIVVFVGLAWTAWLSFRFRASEPTLDGEIAIAGLEREVSILRDSYGVPHIFGEEETDVFFGLGYAHAQDRLFQMDMIRRSVEGRLSEVVGSLGVRLDARARVRGQPQTAAALYDGLQPATRAAVDAYTAGINAFIDGPKRKRPPEYSVLMFAPERWKPSDSMAVALYMADILIVEGDEYERLLLADRLTPEQIEQFSPQYAAFAPRSLTASDITSLLAPDSAPPPQTAPSSAEDGAQPGSNNWVVSGERTVSGAPLLANDPHLGLGAPSVWYFARLALPDGDVVGATIPGAPFVTLGRNDQAAWGFTNASYDVQDLVARPRGQAMVQATREETVKVRLGGSVKVEVAETAEGYLLSPEWFNLAPYGERDVVMKTTADDVDNTIGDTLYRMMKAGDWATFRESLRGWTAPSQSIVFADTSGRIAYMSPGRVPVRDANGAWRGEIPFDALPQVVDPASGVIATANNKITPEGYAYDLPGEYTSYRIARITERLQRTRLHDRSTFRALQLDTVSVHARRLMPVLSRSLPETDEGWAVLTLLDGWDGDMDVDAAEPLIFSAWMREISQEIYADELGDLFPTFSATRHVFIDNVLNGPHSHWCDNINTAARETCAMATGRALDRTALELFERYGFDPDLWTWGEEHVAVFDHPLFTGNPLLDNLYTVREPVGGGADTVNVAAFPSASGHYEVFHGASMRAIYDLADLNASMYIHAPGQSGHPLSPHYRDLAPMWAHGDYIEIRTDWTRDAPPPGINTLLLTPRN